MSVSEALTPSLRRRIAEALDESGEAVDASLRALAGGVVTALARLSDGPTAPGVLKAVSGSDPKVLDDASPLLDGDWRDPASDGRTVFGSGAAALAESIAAATGAKLRSAFALLKLTTSLVLAAIARSGVAGDAAGLRSFLRSLEPEAARLAPPSIFHGSTGPAAVLEHAPRRSRAVWLLRLVLALFLLACIVTAILARPLVPAPLAP